MALGAQAAGIKATIVMPEGAPLAKVEATKGYGAEVVLKGGVYDEASAEAVRLQKETGATLVHAFDDPAVIAGQGTIGLEILEQCPDIRSIVVPIGGGGLLAGIATAVKSVAPHVKVYGVQASGAPAMYLSKHAGKWVETPEAQTIADGIAVKSPGKITFDLIQKYVDDIFVVKDDDIAATILLMMERAKMISEGAGAIGLAAMLHGNIPHADKTAAVISGGNIDVNMISRIIENGLVKSGRRIKLLTHLTDRPGELRRFVSYIEEYKANIVYVYHEHAGRNLPIGQTQVEMDLETRDHAHAEILVAALRRAYYLRGKSTLSIHFRDFKMGDGIASGVAGIGIPASLNNILMSFANIILNQALVGYGDTPVAAMGVAMKSNMLVVLLQIGLCVGIQPLIGYNYGARNKKRLMSVFKFTGLVSVIMGTILTLIMIVARKTMIQMFINDAEVVQYGIQMVVALQLSAPLLGILFLCINTIQGMGKALPSLILTICRQGLIFIPLIFVLNAMFGLDGVIYAQPAADYLSIVVAILICTHLFRTMDHREEKAEG